MAQKSIRIAIVNPDRCKPKKCHRECMKYCPVVKTGQHCIEIPTVRSSIGEIEEHSPIACISESLCIGCGICTKKCPYKAIQIINIPRSLENEITHRYGTNGFVLHRLPTPRPNQVLGLIGINGIGKSTALKILSGNLKPNLGNFDNPPDWSQILNYFRGSELQLYMTKIIQNELRCGIKVQHIDGILKLFTTELVGDVLHSLDECKKFDDVIDILELGDVLNHEIRSLSGGELQRFAIASISLKNLDVYIFDEPSSYLDVRQRLRVCKCIRTLCTATSYVIVVEHDLAVLDYLSDFVCCMYGQPAGYGVVTFPFSVREGINVFLEGFIPTENMRFRSAPISFRITNDSEELLEVKNVYDFRYPVLHKQLGTFNLKVESGQITNSEIVVLLGRNGTGKTTFIRMLAGLIEPDRCLENEEIIQLKKLNVSYKPQRLSQNSKTTVKVLLHNRIHAMMTFPQFRTDVIHPLNLDDIMDSEISTLSGGELQRVAIVLCLGTPADIYLIDEPSAYLDCEQRLIVAKVIKRYILHTKKTAFVVEHDLIMATYLADKVIVYSGIPSVDCVASTPENTSMGMNKFLKDLSVTFRRDPENNRPRINKPDSQMEQEQKISGNYFST